MGETFTLDTSAPEWRAFAEGYVDAIRQAHPELGDAPFAPEALARIIEDCAEVNLLSSGGTFWKNRQAGKFPAFPPLTVTLNDDGKVFLSPTRGGGQ